MQTQTPKFGVISFQHKTSGLMDFSLPLSIYAITVPCKHEKHLSIVSSCFTWGYVTIPKLEDIPIPRSSIPIPIDISDVEVKLQP